MLFSRNESCQGVSPFSPQPSCRAGVRNELMLKTRMMNYGRKRRLELLCNHRPHPLTFRLLTDGQPGLTSTRSSTGSHLAASPSTGIQNSHRELQIKPGVLTVSTYPCLLLFCLELRIDLFRTRVLSCPAFVASFSTCTRKKK